MEKYYPFLACETCRLLCWDRMSSDPGFPDTSLDPPLCWCSETMLAIGPDGEIVSPEHCGPGRPCYDQLTMVS